MVAGILQANDASNYTDERFPSCAWNLPVQMDTQTQGL